MPLKKSENLGGYGTIDDIIILPKCCFLTIKILNISSVEIASEMSILNSPLFTRSWREHQNSLGKYLRSLHFSLIWGGLFLVTQIIVVSRHYKPLRWETKVFRRKITKNMFLILNLCRLLYYGLFWSSNKRINFHYLWITRPSIFCRDSLSARAFRFGWK